MISSESRVQYSKNFLAEVVCQLRFPEILTIGANAPVDFQEAIRSDFPRYNAVNEQPAPVLRQGPGGLQMQQQNQIVNYHFISADGVWRVNLTSKFISLTCSRYTCWEDFAAHLDKPLAAFIRIYAPAYFERVGLRYKNILSRKAMQIEDIPFHELFNPAYLGLLQEEDVQENMISQGMLNTQVTLRGGANARIMAGPNPVIAAGKRDPEIKFIFDQDLFMNGNIPVNMSAGAMQTLHHQAYGLFRGAITQKLHDLLL